LFLFLPQITQICVIREICAFFSQTFKGLLNGALFKKYQKKSRLKAGI